MAQMPETIRLDKNKSVLHLEYAGQTYSLSAEYLRVHSPSAQVRAAAESFLLSAVFEVPCGGAVAVSGKGVCDVWLFQ